MPRIFISYRRSDSIAITGRIYDHLVRAFGEDQVFKDVDDIPLGADFRQVLQREVGGCDILLVIIGPRWVNVTAENGQRRLDDPDDFVRIEVAAGLARDDVLVIPVLVDAATMPGSDSLPPDLIELAYRNAAIVRNDPDFTRDIRRLIDQIREHAGQSAPPATPPRRAASQPAPAARAPAARQPVQTAVPPRKRARRWPWVLVLFALVAVFTTMWYVSGGTVDDFLDMLGLRPLPAEPAVEVPGDERTLWCGGSVTGALGRFNPVETWLFEGERGQSVLLTMTNQESSGELDPALILRTEDGAQIGYDDDSGEGLNARLGTVLPLTGTYQIVASTASSRTQQSASSGRYRLTLDCEVRFTGCDEAVEGYVSADSPQERWLVGVEPGRTLRGMVYLMDSKMAPPRLTLELADPAGRPFSGSEQIDDLTYIVEGQVGEGGLYEIIVSYEGDVGQQQQFASATEASYRMEVSCD
ncbi:MAG: hypothetical protein Kow0077_12720 [Anaerolineae bacterium]